MGTLLETIDNTGLIRRVVTGVVELAKASARPLRRKTVRRRFFVISCFCMLLWCLRFTSLDTEAGIQNTTASANSFVVPQLIPFLSRYSQQSCPTFRYCETVIGFD